MRTRPRDLTDEHVAAALRRGWGFEVTGLSYAPVGFGSHHWHARAGSARWFVTVDDLDVKRRSDEEPTVDALSRLEAALCGARILCDAGLGFVVAPIPTQTSAIVDVIADRFAVAVYPHIAGETYGFGANPTPQARRAVVEHLASLHGATATVGTTARVDDLAIPKRDRLVRTLHAQTPAPAAGPFGDQATALLLRHADAVLDVLDRYDRLVADLLDRADRFVLTHGEPHAGNTIGTVHGPVLIDWDTLLLAPPERDLWSLVDADPSIADLYTHRSGIEVHRTALDVYRLAWDLTEIGLYIDEFEHPHQDSEDTRIAWRSLETHLDPTRWS